jgi:hypothetical protein
MQNTKLKVVMLESNSPWLNAMMEQAGFKSYIYDVFSRKLYSGSTRSSDQSNFLWVRDLPFVLERIRTAPIYIIHNVKIYTLRVQPRWL